MDRPRRLLSELTSRELAHRAAEYRRMAGTAHGHSTIRSLNFLAARYALLAAKREIEEAPANREAIHQDQSEVDKLARLAERAAAWQPDPTRGLAGAIKSIMASDADPYVVMGSLIEGVVRMLECRIPDERQEDIASVIEQLLVDKLQAGGKKGSH